jgi:hypothetical protein
MQLKHPMCHMAPRLWKLEEKKAQLPLDLTHRAKLGYHIESAVSPGRSKRCPVNLTSDKAKQPGYKNRVVGRPKLVLVVASLRGLELFCFRREKKRERNSRSLSCNVDQPWRSLHLKSDSTNVIIVFCVRRCWRSIYRP